MGNITPAKTSNSTKQSRVTKLLVNPDVKRWFDNLSGGSKLTAEIRVRRLDMFCQQHQMTPTQLYELALKDLRTATDLLEDHVTMMESKQYSLGYIEDYVDCKIMAQTL